MTHHGTAILSAHAKRWISATLCCLLALLLAAGIPTCPASNALAAEQSPVLDDGRAADDEDNPGTNSDPPANAELQPVTEDNSPAADEPGGSSGQPEREPSSSSSAAAAEGPEGETPEDTAPVNPIDSQDLLLPLAKQPTSSLLAASVTLTVRYHVNGGTIPAMTSGTTRYRASSSIVQRSTDSGTTWANYTTAVSTQEYPNLVNVATFRAQKTGYHTLYTKAYNTKADGTGLDINQEYSANSTENPATLKRLNGGTAPTQSKTVTLYVNWLANEHTLEINANGGTVLGTRSSDKSLTETYDSAQNATIPVMGIDGSTPLDSVPSTGAYRYGYRYRGLFDAPEGGAMVFDDAGNAVVGTGYWKQASGTTRWCHTAAHGATVQLYAQWESLGRTNRIQFDANGGTGTMDDIEVPLADDARTMLPRCIYTREGYRFIGWSTAADGDGEFYADRQTVPAPSAEDGFTQVLYAQWSEPAAMHIIITHNHADGTVETVDEYRTHSDTSEAFALRVRDGERWSGTTKTCGYSAVSSDGTGVTVDLSDPDVNLVRANVYYAPATTAGDPASVPAPFDYADGTHDLSRLGLHTDKRASAVEGDDRAFDLTLEAWNVSDETAEVGMVLDASGSMAWTLAHGDDDGDAHAGMHRIKVPDELAQRYAGRFIPADLVLDASLTDNSAMGYAGYHYYVIHPQQDEFVALGYAAGVSEETSRKSSGATYRYALDADGRPFAWVDGVSSGSSAVPGWYFVSSANEWMYLGQEWNESGAMATTAQNPIATAKIYQAIRPNNWMFSRFVGCDSALPGGSPFRVLNFHADLSEYAASGTEQARPAQFYVDEAGYLKAFFAAEYNIANGDDSEAPGTGRVGSSYVYEKDDSVKIKVEALQDSIAVFARSLHAVSPESSVGMVRFSRKGLLNTALGTEMLVLLDWANDTRAITEAMNLEAGYHPTAGTDSFTTGHKTGHYYGLTGSTDTITGLQAFADHMAGREPLDESGKYLIVFTDGKDTSGDNAGVAAASQQLRQQGYTIMAVLLKPSGPAAESDLYAQAEAFLKENVASEADLVFTTDPDNPDSLYRIFEDIALHKLTTSLEGYTVRDYLDPRYDLIDENGNITSTRANIGAQVHDLDGNAATLGFDEQRDLYYLEWRDQTIPTTAQSAQQPLTWNARIRVKAKEDFLGGNAVLSNATESSLNRVFHPGHEGNEADADIPAKDFPQVTCSPQTLALAAKGIDSRQFLGEYVSIPQLDEDDPFAIDSPWYWEYLARLAQDEGRERSYYVDKLKQDGMLELEYRYIGSGTDALQHDAIGTITYSLEHVSGPDFGDEIRDKAGSRWRLVAKYTPYDGIRRQAASDALLETGSHAHALRDAVGPNTRTRTADADITLAVVSGELSFDKTVNCADAIAVLDDGRLDTLGFSFTLNRSYEGPDGNRDWINDANPHGKTLAVTITRAEVEAAIAAGDSSLTVTRTFSELPIGAYTLVEALPRNTAELQPTSVADVFEARHPGEMDIRCYVAPGIEAAPDDDHSWTLAHAWIGQTRNGIQEDPNNAQKAHLAIVNGPPAGMASVLFEPHATKSFPGAMLEGGEFEFAISLLSSELADRNSDVAAPAIHLPSRTQTTNTADGNIRFDPIRITGVVPGDRFAFAIEEAEGFMPFVRYDRSQIVAIVEVVDATGEVGTRVSYEKRDNQGTVIAESTAALSFLNEYEDRIVFTPTGETGAALFYLLSIAAFSAASFAIYTRRRSDESSPCHPQ